MTRRFGGWLLAAVLTLSVAAPASASTFTNPGAINIPGNPALAAGPASPYPSVISVTGLPGTVVRARVTLIGVGHEDSTIDLDIMLAGPGGQRAMLMSDVCGGASNGLVLTFDDGAPSQLPYTSTCVSGTFQPSDNTSGLPDNLFKPPAPAGPYPAALSVFNGFPANGEWRLFAIDDAGPDPDVSGITGGWRLELLPAASCAGPQAGVAAHVGTDGDDVLTGSDGPDVMLGLGGKDVISGLGGDDRICGGAGRDLLKGGTGKDRLLGGGAKDRLKGQAGADTCNGGAKPDVASSCEKQKSI